MAGSRCRGHAATLSVPGMVLDLERRNPQSMNLSNTMRSSRVRTSYHMGCLSLWAGQHRGLWRFPYQHWIVNIVARGCRSPLVLPCSNRGYEWHSPRTHSRQETAWRVGKDFPHGSLYCGANRSHHRGSVGTSNVSTSFQWHQSRQDCHSAHFRCGQYRYWVGHLHSLQSCRDPPYEIQLPSGLSAFVLWGWKLVSDSCHQADSLRYALYAFMAKRPCSRRLSVICRFLGPLGLACSIIVGNVQFATIPKVYSNFWLMEARIKINHNFNSLGAGDGWRWAK